MRRYLAVMLRRWAQVLDPQNIVIEIHQVERRDELPNDGLTGIPVFWAWAAKPATIALYPAPSENIALGVRLS